MTKNVKKVVNAWCMYDWANSVYSLVISSTIFPVYYEEVTKGMLPGDRVSFFGFEIVNTVLYSYSLSISFLLVALVTPLLSGIADYGGKRKVFMKFFTYLGGASCIALYFFEGPNIEWGILFSMTACLGYAGSLVFYNSFLPVISTPDKYDIYSARGYSLGYIGSILLLVFNILSIEFPGWFGFSEGGTAVKFSFVLVGVWWIGFSQITFYYLPSNYREGIDKEHLVRKGYRELLKVWQVVKGHSVLKNFLVAFFFYNTGVQTVMYLAALFGSKELGLPGGKLIMTILIIQIVAVVGSFLFAKLSQARGNKLSLLTMVFIWIFICLFAYFVTSAQQFYALAVVVGLVMGGIQSLSRATYSKLIPQDTIDQTSYFSFYDVLDKISIVLGTFSYGLIEQLTGGMRNSTIALGLYFLVGMGFLILIKVPLNRELMKQQANAADAS